MIKTENILSDFTALLEADDYFSDTRIIRAYPDGIKPTLLKKAVIAVGLKSIEVEDGSVGQSVKSGSYGVFADVFVPYSHDKKAMEQIVFRICRDISQLNIVAIEVSGISVNTTAECFVMHCLFTFNDEICFKEG